MEKKKKTKYDHKINSTEKENKIFRPFSISNAVEL